MDKGYIKFWRKIIKWGWFSDTHTFHLFSYLLIKASYTDSEFLGVKINPGQAVIGLKQTSIDTGLSVQSIRTALSHLKSTNEITIKSTNKFSIVTILNYSSYQNQEEIDNNKNNTKNNKPSTNHQQTTNNIQEVKKVRSKEQTQPLEGISEIHFKDVWKDYPSKTGVGIALRNFRKTVKNLEDLDLIKNCLKTYIAHLAANDWKKPQNGSTWFNNWRDWIDFKEPQNPQKPKEGGNTLSANVRQRIVH